MISPDQIKSQPSTMNPYSKGSTYAHACASMWKNAIRKIKENSEKYLPEKVKVMLAELGLDINDAEMIDALLDQWQDNQRVKNKNGTMSVYAKYMEDVRIVLMNEVLGDSFTTQLLFGGGTYNREVASIPSKYVIVPGMKTAKGNPVTLYSPEWVWITSQLLFEQYCHNNGTTVKDSSPVQKEMLKIIYKALSKKVVEDKLSDSNIAVYINFNIIQKKKPSDVQIKISQYMYGDKDKTVAVVCTSGGGSCSFDIMNQDLLYTSGGISYTDKEGKKKIAALLYKRNSTRMSNAVDDALAKQAEEAAEDAGAAEDAPCVQSKKRRCTEALFCTKLPIIGKDGKELCIPFPNFTTHKTQCVINNTPTESVAKSCNPRGSTRGGGSSQIQKAIDQEARAQDNTIDPEMLKKFEGITVTTCTKGDDIGPMPLNVIKIPNKPTIILQPGNLQVNVVLCCDYHPPEWREANLQTDEEADALYFVEEILLNMLKARLHLKKELAKIPKSHNTTVLTNADFNHFVNTGPDAELLLKNSACDLDKNRFNPFETKMPDFGDFGNFDIEKSCQGCDSVPTPTQESELVLAPTQESGDENPTQESGNENPTQKPILMEKNLVTWGTETDPGVIMVSHGLDPYSASACKFTLNVKQHDGKDDENGERITSDKIEVFNKGPYREVKYKVDAGQLIKVAIKTSYEIVITMVYCDENGNEEPEKECTIQVGEEKELPYPLKKAECEGPDSWIIRNDSNILLKITFCL